jgi:hypothetical protein
MSTDMDLVIEAEIVAAVSRADAERLDKRIRLLADTINNSLAKLYELVERAKHGEIHKALGFPSWTACVADVFKGQVRLDREQRRELVGWLAGEGMSQRAIADAVGVSKKTVQNDQAAIEVDTNYPPSGGRGLREILADDPNSARASVKFEVDGEQLERDR